MAEGLVMLTSQMAEIVAEEMRNHGDQQHRFEIVADDDSVRVLLDGGIVGNFSTDGRLQVLLGEFETSLFAYEDDEQSSGIREIVGWIVRWANGDRVVELRRGVFGRPTYWAEMPGYSQQFRRRK